jgi:hypothetical protein
VFIPAAPSPEESIYDELPVPAPSVIPASVVAAKASPPSALACIS